jgi:NADH-quinone oxidoreductase subunit E
MLRGSEDVIAYIENKIGVKEGETTSDGKFYFKREEECLAACVGAPMMQVNHVYYENLNNEKIDKILDGLE